MMTNAEIPLSAVLWRQIVHKEALDDRLSGHRRALAPFIEAAVVGAPFGRHRLLTRQGRLTLTTTCERPLGPRRPAVVPGRSTIGRWA